MQVVGAGDQPAPERHHVRWPVVVALTLLAALTITAATVGFAANNDAAPSTTLEPRLLSDPEPVTIDATTGPSRRSDFAWQVAEFGPGEQLGSVAGDDSGFTAIGNDAEGTWLWRSADGAEWVRDTLIEQLPGVDGVLTASRTVRPDSFRKWGDSTVVFGAEVEQTAVWVGGSFLGYTGAFTSPVPGLIVAGDQLLAVDGRPPADSGPPEFSWWLSDNGLDWARVTPHGLPEEGIVQPISWANGFFYATHYCPPDTAPCPAILYRSADGVEWEPVDIDLGEDTDGQASYVDKVAAATDGLVAIGGIVVEGPQWVPAMWTSSGGAVWSLADLSQAFPSWDTTLQLVSVGDRSATIAIDDVEYELTEGSQVTTDAGTLTLRTINSDSVRLSRGDGTVLLDEHETLDLQSDPFLINMAAHGSHVALLGLVATSVVGRQYGGYAVPVVLLSEDLGATWSASTLGGDGVTSVESMAISSTSLVLVGSVDGENTVWYHLLDRDAQSSG